MDVLITRGFSTQARNIELRADQERISFLHGVR
jgi:hypothetical protein